MAARDLDTCMIACVHKLQVHIYMMFFSDRLDRALDVQSLPFVTWQSNNRHFGSWHQRPELQHRFAGEAMSVCLLGP